MVWVLKISDIAGILRWSGWLALIIRNVQFSVAKKGLIKIDV